MLKLYPITGALFVLALLLFPLRAAADAPPVPAPVSAMPPVLITEVEAGSVPKGAVEEFVELYNATSQPIDFMAHNWHLQIASSSAKTWNDLQRNITLTGIIQPHGYYVVASRYNVADVPVTTLPDIAAQWYSPTISAMGGHVRVVYTVQVPPTDPAAHCSSTTTQDDEVEWSLLSGGAVALPSIDKRSVYIVPHDGLSLYDTLQRLSTTTDGYIDTDTDSQDFTSAPATPAAPTVQATAPLPFQQLDVTADTCDPDAPPDSTPPAPSEPPLPPTDTGSGGTGGTGSGDQGTTTAPAPDPGTDDPVTADPPVAAGLLPLQITELLPNPAAPQTDAADEFVELYNPNDTPYDASGFTLQAGTTTKHAYVLPAGTVVPPASYAVWYSSVSGLSLSNTDGQVVLLDTAGTRVASSDPYSNAPDGQAWVLAAGTWQWSTTPTPGAANALTMPAPTVKKPATASAAQKTAAPKAAAAKTTAKTAVKAAKTTKTPAPKTAKAAKAPAATLTAATVPARNPLHTGILAAIGVIAVLYGAYEYRHDIANKLYQRRSNRSARRKDRAAAARRGSN